MVNSSLPNLYNAVLLGRIIFYESFCVVCTLKTQHCLSWGGRGVGGQESPQSNSGI